MAVIKMSGNAVASAQQKTLAFKTWGGVRKGAGRPRGKGRRSVPHSKRMRVKSYEPQHTTLRLERDVSNLRRWRVFAEIVSAIRGAQRAGFRVVEFSVQEGHLHLLTESAGWKALSDGVRALEIRIARALNRLLKRRGRVFADRYHARGLSSPREVRNALVYVLQNARKHLGKDLRATRKDWLDPFSSAGVFRGWERGAEELAAALRRKWTAFGVPGFEGAPRSWLLREGWRKRGHLRLTEIPAD